VVLSDYCTTGDGLVAALQILAVLGDLNKPASEVCRLFQPFPQLLKNVAINGGDVLEADTVKKAITDAEAKLKESGRLLIRKSGTEPLVRVMAEGEDEGLIALIVNDIVDEIKRVAAA
jgi:phosphoglucosamine mutase